MSRGGYRPGAGRPKGSKNKIPAKGRPPAKNPRGPQKNPHRKNVSREQSGENINGNKDLQVRKTKKAGTEILPGLSCSVYEEMEKISPDVIRAEIKKQMPKLRWGLLETREDRETALRSLPKSKQRNASRRLLKAFGDKVVVSGVSSEPTQGNETGSVKVPLNQEDAAKIKDMLSIDFDVRKKAQQYSDFLSRIGQGDKLTAAEKKSMAALKKELESRLPSDSEPEVICDSADAKEYLEKLLMNPKVDRKTKIQISNILLPYQHPRMGEGKGKKQAREDRARQAGAGKFTPGKPPLKVVKS